MRGILQRIEIAGIAMMFLGPLVLAGSQFKAFLDLLALAFLWAAVLFFGGLTMFILASRAGGQSNPP